MDPSKFVEYELELGLVQNGVYCSLMIWNEDNNISKTVPISKKDVNVDKVRFEAAFKLSGYTIRRLLLSFDESQQKITHNVKLKGFPKDKKNKPEIYEFKPTEDISLKNEEEDEENGQLFDIFDNKDGNVGIKKSNGKILMSSLFILLVALILALFVRDGSLLDVIMPGHSYHSVGEFAEKMTDLGTSFPNQYPLYLRMLTNAGKRQLKRVWGGDHENLRPMSFLVVSYKETGNIIDCFLNKFSQAYTSNAFEVIDSNDFQMEKARLLLDNKIKSSLNSYQKLVVVKQVEKLSFAAAQLFMTYADEHNDLASYPQSTILLSINMPFQSTGDRKTDEERVSSYLQEEIWGDQSTVDNKAALWTRIGDGIVVLKQEDSNACA